MKTSPVRVEALDDSTLPVWVAMRHDFWEDDEEKVRAAYVRYKARNREGAAITFFAAEEDGRYVGFLDAELRLDHVDGARSSPVWYVEGVYVVPDKRGSGVGACPMARLEAHVQELGYSEMASDCEVGNDQSESFHKAVGFQEVTRSIHLIKRLS